MQKFTTLTLTIQDTLATITLNRPEKRNALNAVMIRELLEVAIYLDSQPVSITVINGAGSCFCSGVDISEKAVFNNKTTTEQAVETEQFVDLFFRFSSLRSITIGVAQGLTIGGGVGLLAACDIVIAHGDASFSVTATKIGILPAAMSTVLVQSLGIRWAKYLCLSGRVIDVQTAHFAGLVHIIATNDIDQEVASLLNLLNDGDPTALLMTKRLFTGLQSDMHAMSRAERLSLIREFTATKNAQERFNRYIQEGVFWHRQ